MKSYYLTNYGSDLFVVYPDRRRKRLNVLNPRHLVVLVADRIQRRTL